MNKIYLKLQIPDLLNNLCKLKVFMYIEILREHIKEDIHISHTNHKRVTLEKLQMFRRSKKQLL